MVAELAKKLIDRSDAWLSPVLEVLGWRPSYLGLPFLPLQTNLHCTSRNIGSSSTCVPLAFISTLLTSFRQPLMGCNGMYRVVLARRIRWRQRVLEWEIKETRRWNWEGRTLKGGQHPYGSNRQWSGGLSSSLFIVFLPPQRSTFWSGEFLLYPSRTVLTWHPTRHRLPGGLEHRRIAVCKLASIFFLLRR